MQAEISVKSSAKADETSLPTKLIKMSDILILFSEKKDT